LSPDLSDPPHAVSATSSRTASRAAEAFFMEVSDVVGGAPDEVLRGSRRVVPAQACLIGPHDAHRDAIRVPEGVLKSH
jgi:hypothetical protein